jgi:hypothetical protein
MYAHLAMSKNRMSQVARIIQRHMRLFVASIKRTSQVACLIQQRITPEAHHVYACLQAPTIDKLVG